MAELDDGEEEVIPLAMVWLASGFFGGNRHSLLSWVAPYLSEKALRELRQKMMLDDAARIDAEKLLIDFLDTDPTRPRNRRRVESRMHRNTDWGRTHVAHMTGGSHQYVNRKVEHVPDIPLLSALLGIARRWQQELEAFGGYFERVERMEKACRDIRFMPLPISYDSNMAARLKQCEGGKKLAEWIDKVQGLLWQPFDSKTDGPMLVKLFEQGVEQGDPDQHARTALENGETDKTNADAMLEMIATLALAKAFCRRGWAAVRHGLAAGWMLKDGLTLKKEGVTLHIRKGFPGNIKETDRTRVLLKSVGHEDARGKQPDIVLCFECDHPKHKPIYLIGDAKRNDERDGKPYRRAAFFAMLGDFIAYGHKLGLTISEAEIDSFQSRIKPRGLLFFKQMDEQKALDKDSIITAFGFDEYAGLFYEKNQPNENRLMQTVRSIECAVRKDFVLRGDAAECRDLCATHHHPPPKLG
jgi:hypothetical protein